LANIDSPNGFRPFQQILQLNKYYTTNNSCIGQGHPVGVTASGTVRAATFTGVGGGGAGKGTLAGVAVNFVSSSGSNARREVYVYDHPLQRFSVQATAAIAQTAFYLNYNVTRIQGGAGSATCNRTTGQSKLKLSATTSNTTFGFFHVLGWANVVESVTTAANNRVFGIINRKYLKATSTLGI
jgi:hypothetical protein